MLEFSFRLALDWFCVDLLFGSVIFQFMPLGLELLDLFAAWKFGAVPSAYFLISRSRELLEIELSLCCASVKLLGL